MKKQEGEIDMRRLMEMYKNLATPGQPHKLLAGMAGSWEGKSKTWTEPNQPPLESTGTCERKMILGGRYLYEECSGEMGGSFFSAVGIWAYDNHAKKYLMSWVDSLSTGIYAFEGSGSADGKTITQECRFDDPVKGPMKWRSVTRFVDDNTQVSEMYGVDKDGKEEKMETTYTRKPAAEAVVITRLFDVPRNLVFKAWTESERLTRWWGPKGFTLPVCKIDLRPGGAFHYCMRSPEGREFWGKGVYREIVAPERIVVTDFFADEKGNPVPATHYGMDARWPLETLITVTFAEEEGKTKFTLRHELPSVPASEREMCRQGWNESLDKLAEELTAACAALGEACARS